MPERLKILVVDDEEINRQVVGGALKADYDIIEARGGGEAIRRLKEEKPDLVLLDVMMPDLNGFDVCRLIKGEPAFANIPVIFVTAMDTYEAEARGLGLGGIDFLTKPVDLGLLKLRVRNNLALKQQADLIRSQRDLLARKNVELEAALARVKRLEGIIPICMFCKKIRNDQDSWEQLEAYLAEHTDATFSHGICPACRDEKYPDGLT